MCFLHAQWNIIGDKPNGIYQKMEKIKMCLFLINVFTFPFAYPFNKKPLIRNV